MEGNNNTLKRKMQEDIDEKTLDKRICSSQNAGDLTPESDDFKDTTSGENVAGCIASKILLSKHIPKDNVTEESSDLQTETQVACQEPGNIDEDTAQQSEEMLLTREENSNTLKKTINTVNPESDVSNSNNLTKVEQDNEIVTGEQSQAGSHETDATNIKRNKCAYGDKCYRKNQYHKTKFSHPGDTDYHVPDNRPECAYGVRCYRTNLQHRSEYKHSSIPAVHNRPIRNPNETTYTLFNDYDSSAEESIDESDYEPTDYSYTSDDFDTDSNDDIDDAVGNNDDDDDISSND